MCPSPARRRCTAGVMPPAAWTWLSLTIAASSSPKRWLNPPPQRTAYFCSARRPGRVLRVQTMRAFVPATAFTSAAVAVAVPDSGPRKFSATRSAVSKLRAGPLTVASRVPAATSEPSGAVTSNVTDGSIIRNAAWAQISPAIWPGLRATNRAVAVVCAAMVSWLVMSPARPRSSSSAARTLFSTSSAGGGRVKSKAIIWTRGAAERCFRPRCGRHRQVA